MSKQQQFVVNPPSGKLLTTNEDKTTQLADKLLEIILPVVAEEVKKQIEAAGIKPGSTGGDMAANHRQFEAPDADDGPGSNGRRMPAQPGEFEAPE